MTPYAVVIGISVFLLVIGVYWLGNIIVGRSHRAVEILLLMIAAAFILFLMWSGGAETEQLVKNCLLLLLLLLLLVIPFVIYFLPSIVAIRRRHRQQLAIAMLNLLGGWTLLGWIVAMVWACTDDVETVSQVS
jgi:hypothetical protein